QEHEDPGRRRDVAEYVGIAQPEQHQPNTNKNKRDRGWRAGASWCQGGGAAPFTTEEQLMIGPKGYREYVLQQVEHTAERNKAAKHQRNAAVPGMKQHHGHARQSD